MNPRHAQILEIIKEKKFVSVSALSQVLYTSESTVRRDLIVLEKKRTDSADARRRNLYGGYKAGMAPYV